MPQPFTFDNVQLEHNVVVMGRTVFDRLKPKIGCSITIRWTCSSSIDVRKNDVRVSSMCDLVNVVKALLGSKFDVRVRSPTNEHVRVHSMFEKMMFESVRWKI